MVSDASIVAGDVKSTVQPCTQRDATTHTQQQQHSVKATTSVVLKLYNKIELTLFWIWTRPISLLFSLTVLCL